MFVNSVNAGYDRVPLLIYKPFIKCVRPSSLLFKVLAIARPLSLQCHPTRLQAQEGWKREEGLRKEGKDHNYQDPNPKAEIIAALSPITAMCGFRDAEVVNADLAALIPTGYARAIRKISSSVKELYLGLYALSAEDRKMILEELEASLRADKGESWNGLFLTRKGIALECLEEYPGDIGALFPYLMNVITLQIGEALFLEPDTLHAYVFGNGVELMNASDNVLRGGLTKKRMDLPELRSIMKFEPLDVRKCTAEKDGYGRTVFSSPSPDFRLLAAASGTYEIKNDPIAIVFVTEGAVRFSSKGESLTLSKGEAAVIPSGLEYTMTVRGNAYISEVPDA